MPEAVHSLTAPHRLQYTYKRSTGPVLGRFFGGLKEGRILGVRRKNGSVLVPPKEYDPDTSETLSELVEVGTAGTVVSWAWVAQPREKQPVGQALRVRAHPARRRRHADAARGRYGRRRAQDEDGHARASPLRRGARGNDSRHRGLRADQRGARGPAVRRRSRRASSPLGRAREGARAARLPLLRRPGGEPLPARSRGGQAPRPALPGRRQGLLPDARRVRRARRADRRRDRRGEGPRHDRVVLGRARAVGEPRRSSCRSRRSRSSSTAPTRPSPT